MKAPVRKGRTRAGAAVIDADVVGGPAIDADVIDTDAAAPRGQPCSACGCPVEPDDKFCPACGLPRTVAQRTPAESSAARSYWHCQNCGSELAADLERRSQTCPFCDSTYVVALARDQTGRQEPEFVIGFSITRERAQQLFESWFRQRQWFRPGDLTSAAIVDKLQGVYLPFWMFSMLAESRWHAQVGEYWYRTETYTTVVNGKQVTRTRRVRETEWWPLGGNHHHYHHGYLVTGSKGLPQQQAERIKPFQLPALKRYEPFYLAGWLCEEYSVGRDDALVLCQREFHRCEQQLVAGFLPGDTHSGLDVSTSFSQVNSDLCLLPVYVLSYKYRDRLYRFLVNGQTGKWAGDKPVSWRRIGAVVGGVVAAILILAGIVAAILAAAGPR